MASESSATVVGEGHREPMPLSERAKIFMPFNPLRGFHEALRAKELEVELAVLEGERGPAGDDAVQGPMREDASGARASVTPARTSRPH